MEVMILACHRQFFMKCLIINGREMNVELRVKACFDVFCNPDEKLGEMIRDF